MSRVSRLKNSRSGTWEAAVEFRTRAQTLALGTKEEGKCNWEIENVLYPRRGKLEFRSKIGRDKIIFSTGKIIHHFSCLLFITDIGATSYNDSSPGYLRGPTQDGIER